MQLCQQQIVSLLIGKDNVGLGIIVKLPHKDCDSTTRFIAHDFGG